MSDCAACSGAGTTPVEAATESSPSNWRPGQPVTLKEYARFLRGAKQSTIGAAFHAQQVSDDPEVQEKAKELVRLEREFGVLLRLRGIER